MWFSRARSFCLYYKIVKISFSHRQEIVFEDNTTILPTYIVQWMCLMIPNLNCVRGPTSKANAALNFTKIEKFAIFWALVWFTSVGEDFDPKNHKNRKKCSFLAPIDFCEGCFHQICVSNHREHPSKSQSWQYGGNIFKNYLLPMGNAYFEVLCK